MSPGVRRPLCTAAISLSRTTTVSPCFDFVVTRPSRILIFLGFLRFDFAVVFAALILAFLEFPAYAYCILYLMYILEPPHTQNRLPQRRFVFCSQRSFRYVYI